MSNKNTVTILGILAGVIVLWVAYNWRVNKAIDPVKVPYAVNPIQAAQRITQEDIEYVEISRELLNKVNIITNANQLIGYFVNVGTSIPEGGLFYQSQVVEEKDLPNSIFADIPDGYTGYLLRVDNTSTFANSIYPGDYIDLYMKATDEGKVFNGILIESIKVIGVKDSSGYDVFSSATTRNAAYLVFAVDNRTLELLRNAESISGVDIYPIPRNKAYTEKEGETIYGQQDIIDFIEARSTTFVTE